MPDTFSDVAWRNPVHNHDDTIDCEIQHPVFGWIPFTASINDTEIFGREIYADIVNSGEPITPFAG